MSQLAEIRAAMREAHHADEADLLRQMIATAQVTPAYRDAVTLRATGLVRQIRTAADPGLMEVFLAEYGLSTDEGIALMCLAEALLRVPDAETIDALIEDKIAPSAWGAHLGQSSSSLVNASTWALMLTGKVLQDGTGIAATLRGAIKRVGEPVIRLAVGRAMKELGAQFVLGETIDSAVKRGAPWREKGYTFSYDMLGEAALTAVDAATYLAAYQDAITRLVPSCTAADIRRNPGISIKLSALHPRYEVSQRAAVMAELVPRVLMLAQQAKAAGMGLNIDAEEADRLDLSLDVIAAVFADESLAGWDGFGVVVQAYGKRATHVIAWLNALAQCHDRKMMVRLVKGAYWDTEIKRAQVEGLKTYPVFTQKAATDVSYMICARQLLENTDRLYPQFATHNAHSMAAILEMDAPAQAYEFQRLHGMGAALHDLILAEHGVASRIYAPVGAHEDLLAYLVRRLLENGANSSFVNMIVDGDVPAEVVAADPFADLDVAASPLPLPQDIYQPERVNAHGWDLRDWDDLAAIEAARAPFHATTWDMQPLIVGGGPFGEVHAVINPAEPDDIVGCVAFATAKNAAKAIAAATPWRAPADTRARVLNRIADLYEAHFGTFAALLAREAGKTHMDVVAEVREAVDFLRYYAARATDLTDPARGIFTCISPWNFPLAIYTGQIAAALAAGNGVLAKPAEATSLTAVLAGRLMHQAGVPQEVLQVLPGEGGVVGAALTAAAQVDGVCFTGSTATAQQINRSMASHLDPGAPLIAETGGLNAMIVDSTALPEQAVRDIVASAFQSAGQRCSALRVLYLQEDIADGFLKMLFGAMDALTLGDPWDLATDIGPVIDARARDGILQHVARAEARGRVLKQLDTPERGTFVGPTVIAVNGIGDVREEVFGPVLHVARFAAADLTDVIDDVNATGFGLTFGLHTRIDDRVTTVTQRVKAGNIYVNRNQIGAVVGSQPFGGEGLSGTGPKAGGPDYVARFTRSTRETHIGGACELVSLEAVQRRVDAAPDAQPCLEQNTLPGPTGESNVLTTFARGRVLCLGPGRDAALAQAARARAQGCEVICVAEGLHADEGVAGQIAAADLTALRGIAAVVSQAEDGVLRAYCVALAAREGMIVPLLCDTDLAARSRITRHVCIDTTAAGGNAALLAGV